MLDLPCYKSALKPLELDSKIDKRKMRCNESLISVNNKIERIVQ